MRRENIIAIQKELGVVADGFWGPKSIAASQTYLKQLQAGSGIVIPDDTDAALIEMFGPPGQQNGYTPPLKKIKLPFKVRVGRVFTDFISVHEKIAEPVLRAYELVLKNFPSEKDRSAAGVNIYDGCYNPRLMRGSSSRLSRHSWAIAIDINAANNGNLTKWPERATMPWEVIKCFTAAGFMPAGPMWLRDAMHFQLTKI